jgi:hypothetical protein
MRQEKERLLEANREYQQMLAAKQEVKQDEKTDLDDIPVRDVSLRFALHFIVILYLNFNSSKSMISVPDPKA